ncbi:MAG: carboxy terminal-processing peptidase [Opitutus sp.]|nr:carboxy terminal-processing peptidase [Opitutus sp.]MCS6246442.1 carboxy terminal-processing peptidase [Opitutus sp.]MCS6274954.1 carboxy terminal-processing peptidase [Opitutus sp.]MCS6278737.1 carboxy terminal-processing peptidase [Opitutus sp.]MCS6299685.1 carboxy terminal-processing peptidase [Opitutus sp.]
MHLLTRLARLACFALLPFLFTTGACAEQESRFRAPPLLDIEARTLIKLLEEVHYNRDAVKTATYAEVIPDYLTALDGQRLFFLETDKADFVERYKPDSLYWTLTSMGKIDAAYAIFTVYQKRVTERVEWIQQVLKGKFDLTTNDSFLIDRSKAAWPATVDDADSLWNQRLRFELIKEVLNKKSLEEAKKNVGKRYARLLKNMSDIESSDISEMFLGCIARLYDPHSTYFSADTYEDFGIQMRLQLVGIGALLSIDDDQCVIKDVIPGGPADLDKQIKANDKIISVAQDGGEPVEVIGMKLRKIVDMIRGAKGTRVHLLIEPVDGATSATRKQIVITRNVVNLDSSRAHGAIFEVPDAEGKITPIGVITLPTFYGPDMSGEGKAQNSATKDIEDILTRMKTARIQGLVLDLRRNGGGLLSEAISLTGLFIKNGPVVQVRAYSGEIKVDDDDDPSIAYDGPLTVLVSRFSASASEIVAGALQNYGRAVIVGDSSTHGKGSVQTVLELRNLVPQLARGGAKSGATKLTVQKFYLPNGASTQLKGVEPDVVLPSVNNFLPIGESDLPHALAWDHIASSRFNGQPLSPAQLSPLVTASAQRQSHLAEFDYQRRAIEWFKTRQEQKSASLNLEQRQLEKVADETFKKNMKAERKQLAAADYKFAEVLLAPPAPPRAKSAKKDEDSTSEDDEPEDDENERYPSADIPLREALRVVQDLIKPPVATTIVTITTTP